MIIDNELKNVMRSHHDIEKDNTPYMRKAMRVCIITILCYGKPCYGKPFSQSYITSHYTLLRFQVISVVLLNPP